MTNAGSTFQELMVAREFIDDRESVMRTTFMPIRPRFKQIENFVNWCDKNYLYLNVSKTKDMCIDFRKNQRCPKPVYIKGEAVERVDTYNNNNILY